MTATYAVSSKPMTFAEFLEWKPNRRYELHNGVAVEMQPTGKHDKISGFLAIELALEIRRCNLNYFLGRDTLIKAPEGDTAYAPDGVVIDRTALAREPLWQKSSTLIHGTSIPLVIEITSNNWRDDYWHKLSDYETLGIAEYWIVDYQALGGRRYIGEPKVPTISVFQLVNEEYQAQLFRGNDRIRSKVFPELNLTAEQIFRAGA